MTSRANVPEEEMDEGATPAHNFLDLVVMHVTSALRVLARTSHMAKPNCKGSWEIHRDTLIFGVNYHNNLLALASKQ